MTNEKQFFSIFFVLVMLMLAAWFVSQFLLIPKELKGGVIPAISAHFNTLNDRIDKFDKKVGEYSLLVREYNRRITVLEEELDTQKEYIDLLVRAANNLLQYNIEVMRKELRE